MFWNQTAGGWDHSDGPEDAGLPRARQAAGKAFKCHPWAPGGECEVRESMGRVERKNTPPKKDLSAMTSTPKLSGKPEARVGAGVPAPASTQPGTQALLCVLSCCP